MRRASNPNLASGLRSGSGGGAKIDERAIVTGARLSRAINRAYVPQAALTAGQCSIGPTTGLAPSTRVVFVFAVA